MSKPPKSRAPLRAELAETEAKATPGPWFSAYAGIFTKQDPEFEDGERFYRTVGYTVASHGDTPDNPHDGNLIEALRNLAPELIGLWRAVAEAPHYLSPGIRDALAALKVKASILERP